MANIQTFTGDGTTTSFYFTFPFFGVNDIHVSVASVPMTSNDFSVSPTQTPGDADIPYTGGSITFATAPANGATIRVWRTIELTRDIDYQPTLQPQSYQLNQDLNKCIEILKEQSETLTNAISIATVPTLSNLLSEVTEIRGHIGDCINAVNTLTGYDYVVATQESSAANNYTWYRKYKSGWIEQGQKSVHIAHNTPTEITLPVTMAGTNYTATASCTQVNSLGTFGALSTITICANGTTSLYIGQYNNASADMDICWNVCGMAA